MTNPAQFRPKTAYPLAEVVPTAVILDEAIVVGPPLIAIVAEPRPRTGFLGGIVNVWEWLFGTLTLMVGLAVLAALPLLQFLTLGYLLEAGGRVGRSGRLRDGFIGARLAYPVGSIVLGVALMLLPLQIVSSLWMSAEVIDPGGSVARGWKIGLVALTIVMGTHIALACARGGKLRHFLLPFTTPYWLVMRIWRGGYYVESRDAVWNYLMSLRLPYYFWLGLRGFIGGFVLLALPVTLLVIGRKAPLVGVLGWFLLVAVVLHLPFLQIHFAAQNRLRAMFEIRAVRNLFRRAPWALLFALLLTLGFALPLYLLKIEMIPREAAWLPSLVFITFIFPARLLTGWCYSRAARRPTPRHWTFRWSARFGMLVVALFYGLVVYFTQFVTWGGIWSLYEQHAFLLPVPFFGM